MSTEAQLSPMPFADAVEIAAMLSQLAGSEVVPVDGGFRVKETEDCWIDVLRMIWNWRVAVTPKDTPWSYERHWCYAGTSLLTLIRAVGAVADWDGADSTEPEGWNKNGQTDELRKP